MNDSKYLFLKFPTSIKYADMGSADLSAEKSMENVLKIKANRALFGKTNLSVVTTDGKYYNFNVSYDSNPTFIAIDMTNVKDSISSSDMISATRIEVSDLNTTHIILPAKVEDIAIGHEEVISEKAEGIDNIVKVKSIVGEGQKFCQTSITVVTADGGIFPMIVDYAQYPAQTNISFARDDAARFRDVNVNDNSMYKMAKWIISKGEAINNIGTIDNKTMFKLSSVYTDQDIIAFFLQAGNSSDIDYSIDFVKAYIRDKKTGKKSTLQEDELFPIYSFYSNNDKIIHGKSGINIVLFFKKFTIPEKKVLFFEMFEENGGRHTKFTAPNNTIIKAKVMDKIE